MKILVSKYLNARIGSASVNASIRTYKSPGDFIDIDSVVVGDDIEGNVIWYHNSEDLCYYWSGGIDETEFAIKNASFVSDGKKAMLVMAEAKDYFWRKYRDIMPELTGMTIENNGDFLLVFQFLKMQDATIPAILYFKGFTITTKRVTASNSEFHFTLGSSISRNGLREWGSSGIKLRGTMTGNEGNYLLTNYHVAAADFLKKDIFTYSYGEDDDFRFCNMPAWFSNPKKENEIGWLYSGLFNDWHDVALIYLNSDEDMTNETFDGTVINDHIDIFNDPDYVRKNVVLYGAKSGRKSGHILSVNASQRFKQGTKSYYKENLIQITNTSNPGDSGCPVLYNQQLIGLLVGSDTLSSYVLPIQRILNNFYLKL